MFRPATLGFILATVLAGCEPETEPAGVGDPCVPEEEHQPTFGGFDYMEVSVETGSVQCRTRVCLVNQFQGRVSCPYGQTEADLELPATDPRRCRLPGTSDPVTVRVPPQLVRRTAAASPPRHPEYAKDAVYCSCRCDGPDPNARYCRCPSGFHCEKLIEDLGFGSAELAGSYCVEDGTEGVTMTALECNAALASCGNDGKNP